VTIDREELVGSAEELERKSAQLAHSLAMLRATLEATADAIVVTDADRVVTDYNEKYARLWEIDPQLLATRDHHRILASISGLLLDPQAFLREIDEIYGSGSRESFHVLKLKDGRVIERVSKPQLIGERNVGRVWSFRDITDRIGVEQSVHDHTHILEMLNKTGGAVASQLETEAIVQVVTDAATQLAGAQFGAFFYNTVGKEGEAFTLYTLSGAPREAFADFPLPRATALFGATFRGEGIIRSDDILSHPDYGKSQPYSGMPPGHLPVRSYMAVPVISRMGIVHGGLFFGHERPGMFTQRHELIVSGIAAQAAVAIDNARLFEASQHAQQQLQHLNEVLEVRVIERTEALRSSESQFELLVAGVTDCAIYMLDPRGYVISWNPGAERIKGYTGAEAMGRHVSEFYTEEDRANAVPQHVLSVATTKGKFEGEGWRVRKDGTRFWAGVLIDAIRNTDGVLIGFAKITRDMTERRMMQEQLHQSQKMEAIGQLTGGVAHDFNNLLTVILGNLETLWRQIPAEDGRLRRAIDQATRGAQRAATLTQQLLAFSRRQPLNPKPTDVNKLVSGLSDLIRRTLREDISIETVLGGGLWRIEVDAHQLESALLNLAVNARDAMPTGGKLTIETANTHLDEDYAVRFVEINPGQYVVICITDTGSGMSSEVLARAFDPFFTTKPIGQGTGLGLSQVFGFVKQSGGHIKLYSEVGQGTTVKIYLPRMMGDHVAIEPESRPVALHGSSSEPILVVEDDDDVRIYSTDSLRELGFTVLEAHDGPSALRVLEAHPEIKLLFTDVGLPGINGRELVEQARKLRPRLRVLFTTGYARNAIVHQGRLDPGVELLTKPFTRTQLAERVRHVLDTKMDPTPGQRSALVVEDEPLVRLFLAETLEHMGFEVAQSATARDAAAVIDRLGSIEVAIIDIGLPDRSGAELAKEFRSRWPEMRVVIASGYGEQRSPELQRDPYVSFLKKPYNDAAIRATFEALGVTYKLSEPAETR
jgi:PAS domain S-box-containing protein